MRYADFTASSVRVATRRGADFVVSTSDQTDSNSQKKKCELRQSGGLADFCIASEHSYAEFSIKVFPCNLSLSQIDSSRKEQDPAKYR